MGCYVSCQFDRQATKADAHRFGLTPTAPAQSTVTYTLDTYERAKYTHVVRFNYSDKQLCLLTLLGLMIEFGSVKEGHLPTKASLACGLRVIYT